MGRREGIGRREEIKRGWKGEKSIRLSGRGYQEYFVESYSNK